MVARKFIQKRSVLLRLLLIFTTVIVLYLVMDMQLKMQHLRVALYQDQPLLDLKNFHLITSPYACQSKDEVKALLVITSHSGNVQARMSWRNAMPTKTLEELKVRRVFLVALPKPNQEGYHIVNETQVRHEADEYMDIVQGNFIEDYHNLSYKNVMGLQWGVQFCPQAQMLIKVDDDTAINLPLVLEMAPPLLVNGTMIGAQFYSPEPLRNETKWAVSLEEWPSSHYPDYLSGMMYLTTPAVAARLIAALGTDFFWVDDVFITGVGTERAQIPLFNIVEDYSYDVEELRCCVNGGGCEFLASVSDDWQLLEQYHRLTFTPAVQRKGRGNCVTQP